MEATVVEIKTQQIKYHFQSKHDINLKCFEEVRESTTQKEFNELVCILVTSDERREFASGVGVKIGKYFEQIRSTDMMSKQIKSLSSHLSTT